MKLPQLEKLVVDALEDIKGRDIEVINTSRLTSLFDRMVIACGDSNRQVKVAGPQRAGQGARRGRRVLSCEGEEVGEWVLVDLGDIIVHVMQPAVRSYYNLEELWGGKGPLRVRRAMAEVGPQARDEAGHPRRRSQAACLGGCGLRRVRQAHAARAALSVVEVKPEPRGSKSREQLLAAERTRLWSRCRAVGEWSCSTSGASICRP
jgi:ribosome-associated protein